MAKRKKRSVFRRGGAAKAARAAVKRGAARPRGGFR